MTITRDQVQVPTLGEEVTEVPVLGGGVIVRGMLMSARMDMWDNFKALEGETKEQAAARASAFIIPETLARSVFLDDGKPLFTTQEWDAFASKHNDECLRIYEITKRLNGGDAKDIAKN